jgi:hypothetical protein
MKISEPKLLFEYITPSFHLVHPLHIYHVNTHHNLRFSDCWWRYCRMCACFTSQPSSLQRRHLEAGPKDFSERVMAPLAAPTLHGSPLEYNYTTTIQPHLSNRKVPTFGGWLLSGSSAVNYDNWSRCHSADYDAWADLVGNQR